MWSVDDSWIRSAKIVVDKNRDKALVVYHNIFK